MTPFHKQVRATLQRGASATQRKNAEWYFKKAARFHGWTMPALRRQARTWLGELKPQGARRVAAEAWGLLRSPYWEEKQGAVMLLEFVQKKEPRLVLDRLARVFARDVHDWATSDALSGRVLRHILVSDPNAATEMVRWARSGETWQQRAAAVAFLSDARHGRHHEEILATCDAVVRNPERFAQLGAGWVLRELYLGDSRATVQFLRAHLKWMSREGLRYALEKMPKPLQQRILKEHLAVKA